MSARTVWIVTEGRYSDYRIMNVFADEASAEAFVAWQRGPEAEHDDPRVEEWELHDGQIPPTGAYQMSATVGRPSRYDDCELWYPDEDPEREPEVSFTNEGHPYVNAWGRTSEEARQRRDARMQEIVDAGGGS